MTAKRKRQSIPSDWRELPSTILENIYFYLDRRDQLNMSLVCKSWSQEYGSPKVWKNFVFILTNRSLEPDVCQEVKFAKKFGSMFRHLEIKLAHETTRDGFEKAGIQIELFLEAIIKSNCQLSYIKFDNFAIYDGTWYYFEYPKLFQRVLNFMRFQKNLQTVELYYCKYKEEDGVNLLRLICENNANTLKTLSLNRFIRFEKEESRNDLMLQYRKLMQSFMNLQILETDYSQTFESCMHSFSVDQIQSKMTKRLSLIKIHCDGFHSKPLKGIQCETWQNLRRLCPDVKVKFYMDYLYYPRVNPFSFYLVKYIPLVHLTFWGQERLVIENFLQHLDECILTQHLEYLSIQWWSPEEEDISADFIPFLQTCQNLKTLKMYLSFPVAGIEDLFSYLFESRPVSLESVYLSLEYVMNDVNRSFLMLLADEYSPLLKTIGLNLTVVAFISHSTENLS